MSKNISVKTEEPFCQLVGLPGVNRDIDSYWINDTTLIPQHYYKIFFLST